MAWNLLNMFDDPNAMAQLLGAGGPGTDPGANQPAPPLPPASAMPQGQGGIGSDYASSPYGQAQQQQLNAPPQMNGNPAVAQSVLDNSGYNPGSGVSTAPGMMPPDPTISAQTPDYPNGVPMPPHDPRQMPVPGSPPMGQGGVGSDYASSGGQSAPGALPPGARPTGFPGAKSPPLPPASAMPGPGAPTASNTGSLAGMLGIDPNRLRAGMAGVGRGLSAVGNAPAGATAGKMIGRGGGGSLQGGAAAQEQQQTQLFNQSSTAFKDMLAAKASNNMEGYRNAQSQYLMARAQSLMTGGTGSSRAWQNTDYGKTIQVENESQKYEKGQQILLQKKWSLNATSPEDQQKDLDQLNKNVDAYRGRLYKQIGVDPSKGEKLKDMGTSAANPFDVKDFKGTPQQQMEQFHSQVPMGGWFKDQNGVVRQRTVPPPGSGAQPSAAAPGAATNYDDLTAMQPAA